MNITEAQTTINSFMKYGMQLGLERIDKLLNLIGNPQDKLKFVHIAGTNGKGSTCVMTSSILTKAGYKTGLFISPYVTCFRERMQISNVMISEDELARILDYIMVFVKKMAKEKEFITEFELITAVALKWFADNNCDIVILEVGLGGLYDATNVIKNPIASVITSISLDHVAILGNSIEKIAYQKCGIIKQNSVTIIYPEQKKEALDVILKVAKEKDNEIIIPDLSEIKLLESDIDGNKLIYNDKMIELPLVGEYQIKNLSVVLEIIKVLKRNEFKITSDNLKEGLKKVVYPARFEIISKNPLIIVDGSHNPDGIKSLVSILIKNLTGKKLIGIIGMLKDKDVENSLKNLAPLFSEIVITSPRTDRSLPEQDLKKVADKYCDDVKIINDKKEAVDYSLNKLSNEKVLIVCGSLYLASEIRPILIQNIKELH